jgi:N-acetylneuraminic acid mutarotase
MILFSASRAPLAAIFLTALVACSGKSASTVTNSSTSSSSSSSSGSGGSGGSQGSGGSCPAYEHLADGGACDTTLTWQSAGTINPARHHHVTFVAETKAGPFLYVAGGYTGSAFLTAVSRAAIQANGSLGSWQSQTALPSGLAGHMIVYGAGHAVVMGGLTATGEVADVLSAPIDDTGAVGAWAPQAMLPVVRMHGAAALSGSNVYVVGGLGASMTAIANVERATLGADGSIASWEELAALPGPRSHHAMVIAGSTLYVIGGLQGDPAGTYTDYLDVLAAPIQADGTLGTWTTAGTLPVGIDTASAVVTDGDIYVIGGVEGDAYVNHVRRAPILPDHTLGAWQSSAPLPKGRGHVHQTPLYQGNVYSVGGSIANLVAIPDVFRGTFK